MLTWPQSIQKVLAAFGPLHYAEITEKIGELGLRKLTGATPVSTVSAIITDSIAKEGEDSPYVRVAPGVYALTLHGKLAADAMDLIRPSPMPSFAADPDTLIRAFGMYWERSAVDWKHKPRLYGIQFSGSAPVDMGGQVGVYLLHDGHRTVYVGRADKDSLGDRLSAHTRDRMTSRWNRFSWFGFYAVKEDGGLDKSMPQIAPETLATVLEALLIEVMEPPLNRRRGDGVLSCEFLQAEDPAREKARQAAMEQAFAAVMARR